MVPRKIVKGVKVLSPDIFASYVLVLVCDAMI